MNKLLTPIILFCSLQLLSGQEEKRFPKLVIGIQVDQLRSDYLSDISPGFGEKGFKRLMKEGTVFNNAHYDFPAPDGSSAIAAIQTGTVPNKNGIIGSTYFNTKTKEIEQIITDPDYIGHYTSDRFSPRKLSGSTIADELKVATEGKGVVFSIAPDAEQAILGAGHGADGAFWLDNRNGEWAGTTYYGNPPFWLIRYNDTRSPVKTLDTLTWQPLYAVERYNYLPFAQTPFAFYHNFKGATKEVIPRFKRSALINKEIINLAIEAIEQAALGKDNYPDLLNLTLYAGNYRNQPIKEAPIEIQDTYVRLDRDIARIIQYVEKKIGLENVLFYVTSTGTFEADGADPERFRIPTGTFYPDRCCALLNIYLMAIYGQGDWVLGYHNRAIFLNRKLIEEKQIALKEIQNSAAEFTIQFSGIQDVATSHQLIHSGWSSETNEIKNGYHRILSGDLLLEISAGWQISSQRQQEWVRNYATLFPIIYFGSHIRGTEISRKASVVEIAPSVCRLMRIRAPNQATSSSAIELE